MGLDASALEALLRQHLGNALRLSGETVPTQAARIATSSGPLFLKPGPADRVIAEADGLAALAQAGLRVPKTLVCHADGADSFLLLEYLDLQSVRTREAATACADALACLHTNASDRFGWPADNFIGATPQANTTSAGWARFFVEQRLRPQFAQARRHGYDGTLQRNGERLMEQLPALFLDGEPTPALLHGDLWHGNFGLLADGTPVFFDPAVYYGDPEADLAMSELFGGLPDSFYAAYRRRHPLSANYETRKLAYNLYHILNHLNLFGRAYLRQTELMAAQLARQLQR